MAQNTYHFAFTRTDLNNELIDGPVATMIIEYEDLQSGEPIAYFSTGSSMSASGELTPTDNTSFQGILESVGATPAPSLSAFITHESCYTLGTATAQATNGTPPYTYAWSNGVNTAHVSNLLAGTYTVEVADDNGDTQSLDIQVNYPNPTYDGGGNEIDCDQYKEWTTLDICALLEGAYDNNAGIMRNALKFRNVLPTEQPYNKPPWNYQGIEGQGLDTSDYSSDMVDWVLITFRAKENKEIILAKTAAILLQDGCVEFMDDKVLRTNISDSIYIVIEHRNHIAAMTPHPIAITNNILTYDFRILNEGQKQLSSNTWGMYAGDCDQSDQGGYDINGADKILWESSNGIFGQYKQGDMDMDADVNGQDKIMWESNNGRYSDIPR